MAITIQQMSLIVLLLAFLSFQLGMVAYFMKHNFGTPVTSKDGTVTCDQFSYDLIILSSVAFLAASTVAGCISVFYPYKQQSVPPKVLFKSKFFRLIIIVSLISTDVAATLLCWPTITEQYDLNSACPTAKHSDLIVLGAVSSLCSGLFWLYIVLAREDVTVIDNDVNGAYLAI